MGPWCNLIRCPSCQYEFPEQPQSVTWLRGLLGRRPLLRPEAPGDIRSIRELKSGERATILCLGGGSTRRRNSLAVFGLVPGAELAVLQHHPACVIQVGETELALDDDIARGILVQPNESAKADT
ncbi:MAG: hypothetical protein GTN62_09610 [Gemmatimonadales bacterium]|nr:hypothetical protein [Gemmatimonadales bacterium]NIN11801.1 hypothetical protein [Gemmatimonadales bacterium]NIN50351.1 hypothetical protein [Gemmatimonadales bacterium]NIP07815.1 hypothetical protein [Gemmatimonadales bacterium]NIR01893.1 hypothetical protein [Gemmatimonadales bacterium]